MTMHRLEVVENLIQHYVDKGGQLATVEEGSLGYGTTILFAPPENKLKFVVIQERFLNCWSSGHTIRMYNNIPNKYQKWLDRNI